MARNSGSRPALQLGQPLRRADVAPLAAKMFAAQDAECNCAPQQRQQRKSAGRAASEEIGPVDGDARERVHGIALREHAAVLQSEIAARMMRRVVDQDDVSVRAPSRSVSGKFVRMSLFTTMTLFPRANA
jgi:hypothetical protein